MSELDDDSLFDAVKFITQTEQENITLSSLFFKDSQTDSNTDVAADSVARIPVQGSPLRCNMPAAAKYKIWLFRDGQAAGDVAQNAGDAAPIKGVVSFSESGQFLHCLRFTSDAEKAEFRELLAAEIPQDEVFCILGEKQGSELIASAIKKRRRQTRHYMLMHFVGNAGRLLPPEELELVKCGIPQLNALVPLQMGYEIDEVLMDKDDFDEAVSRLTMRKFLREQIIYALFAKPEADGVSRAVAKAGTNARGLNWYQLGGVYTVPGYRGQGCAAFLAQHLALTNAEMGKRTALFVKDENIPAQKAYKKAGFVPDKPFEIIYY